MRIFVTGATGFIGRNLVPSLVQDGHEVFKLPPEVDVTDYLGFYDAVRKADPHVIVHGAAVVSSPRCHLFGPYTIRTNVAGAANALFIAESLGCKLVYLSSSIVYRPTGEVITEEHPLDPPRSLYAISKFLAEEAVRRIGLKDLLILRLCHVYGPQDGISIIDNIIEGYRKGYPVVIRGHPNDSKDYLYIDDCVKALRLAIDKDLRGIFNISAENPKPLGEIVKMIITKIIKDVSIPLVPIFYRPELNYLGSHVISSRKFREVTGWKPEVELEEGIKRCIMSGIRQ
jgi:nucleoside-diphosphate-sugar epimerase